MSSPLHNFWETFKKEEQGYTFEDFYYFFGNSSVIKAEKKKKFYIIKMNKAGSEQEDNLIHREYQVLQRLKKIENIPRTKSYKFNINGYIWLIKDYVEGKTMDLVKQLKNEEEMKEELKEKIKEIYNSNVCVHDLRPSNIIITPDFKPRLFDFNYSMLVEQAILTHSPEQLLEDDISQVDKIFKTIQYA